MSNGEPGGRPPKTKVGPGTAQAAPLGFWTFHPSPSSQEETITSFWCLPSTVVLLLTYELRKPT